MKYRKAMYMFLQKIYKFNQWHISLIDERPYALRIVDKINEIIRDNRRLGKYELVEVGCGLGDILAGIKVNNKMKNGYDIEKNVCRAAKLIHPTIKFEQGTFNKIKGKKISFLIAVNFLHEIDTKLVTEYLNFANKHNVIRYIVVDKVASPPYQYSHDYNVIMQQLGYSEAWRSRGYKAWNESRRYIIFYKNTHYV